MNRQPQGYRKRFWYRWLIGAVLFLAAGAPAALGQTPTGPVFHPINQGNSFLNNGQVVPALYKNLDESAKEEDKENEAKKTSPAAADTETGCASGGPGCTPAGGGDCGGNSGTIAGRIFGGLTEELCCPDPGYEGKWLPIANAAFFVEGTRPVSTLRIRWEYANDFAFPDRSEYFWSGSKGGGRGPANFETRLRYNQLSLYQEIAVKGFSAFIDIPYLRVDPQSNPSATGFGDMKAGAKALIFDRDLFQLGFMFQTYIPVGNVSKGLGTGHVSLEPSLLATLKLTPETYLQSQLSEWVPVGSDSDFQGSICHYHFSINHELCRPAQDVNVIGTVEFTGYSFLAGQVTTAPNLFQPATNTGYFTLGPGLRLVVGDWLDIGFGAAFALSDHGPNQTYRSELRIRF